MWYLDRPGRLFRMVDTTTSQARPADAVPRADVDVLTVRLERANLLIQTLLLLLLEKQVIHEDEFKEWLVYVDELDGTRDGRVKEAVGPLECPKCGRRSPKLATKCIYCGYEFEVGFLTRRPPPTTATQPEAAGTDPDRASDSGGEEPRKL